MSANSGGQHNLTFEGSINPGGSMSNARVLCDSIAGRLVPGSLRVPARRWPERGRPDADG